MTFLDNHRGPFELVLTRALVHEKTGAVSYQNEHTKGTIDRADVRDVAQGLLDDPRDTVTRVHVWSVSEGQFVGAYPDAGDNR